ncbi:ETC complex I subunit [Xanthobacter dioxanivorans]|uniref:ETC complex I subunit n=1 Tax=Xanthobacter dioxanivorans TaxID=2528964 RepID=A0A974PL46_9HYPH|nr:ETC complex I subunit [Xanthobacter dioxanivorans]QRG05608.1 ETC complex I subunit [Xanthobacter dioxanivorans]
MVARIYKPSRNAMQSGVAKTKHWVLDYEPEHARMVEPLMGYTSSADMRSQIHLTFETKEEAIAYAQKRGIPFQVFEPHEAGRRRIAYSDNFATSRLGQWTH